MNPTATTQMPDNNAVIDVQQVVKTYTGPAGSFTALKGVDLQVYSGESVAVIGKSGSGKSTLINVITGIDRPTSGEIYIANTRVHGLSENQLALWRGKTIGLVFQFFQLLPTLTVIENVMLPMDLCNVYAARERRRRAAELLDLVDMNMHARKLPSALSGGQQQRVAIARALANDPPLIVADEPTGNLDSQTANTVFQLFDELVAVGRTVLMVTHDSDLAYRCSRTVTVVDGMIVHGDTHTSTDPHSIPDNTAPMMIDLTTGESQDSAQFVADFMPAQEVNRA